MSRQHAGVALEAAVTVAAASLRHRTARLGRRAAFRAQLECALALAQSRSSWA